MSKTNNSYEHLGKIVREKFKALGFANIEIAFQNGSNAGDGYLSDIVRAEISGDRNGTQQNIDAIIKRATKDSEVRGNIPTVGPFKREIFFYTKVVPIYEKLQQDFDIEDALKIKFPKCHAVNDTPYDEFIILENLKSQDYKMTERLKLDKAHAHIAVDTLARLHALSYVFEKTYPEKFKELSGQVDEPFLTVGNGENEFEPSLLKAFYQKCFKKAMMSVKDEEHKRRLSKAFNNVYEVTVALCNGGERRAILHGDYWTNNIFYKYKNCEPNELIPFDYQMVRYASPAIDISYLLFCNTDADFRRDHHQQLLEHYYNSLDAFLKRFHYNVEEIYPKKIFWKELATYSLFGLSFAFLFMVAALRPSDENVSLLDIWNNDDIFGKDPVYEKRMNDLIVDCVAYGYI